MGKIKILILTDTQHFALEDGFRNGCSHCFRMRCRAVLLKSKGISSQKIGEQRGLFLFYLPPYSSQLNIAETLWRILKGKWIRPQDYISKDTLFYAVNRALADIGKGVAINFKHYAA